MPVAISISPSFSSRSVSTSASLFQLSGLNTTRVPAGVLILFANWLMARSSTLSMSNLASLARLSFTEIFFPACSLASCGHELALLHVCSEYKSMSFHASSSSAFGARTSGFT